MTVLTMVLSSPARMIVKSTPRKTRTLFCPDEFRDCIVHIARYATHCKVGARCSRAAVSARLVRTATQRRGYNAERVFSVIDVPSRTMVLLPAAHLTVPRTIDQMIVDHA